jgi:hypothetical protein
MISLLTASLVNQSIRLDVIYMSIIHINSHFIYIYICERQLKTRRWPRSREQNGGDILAVDFIAGMVFKLWREFPSSLRAFLERPIQVSRW